MLDDSLEFAAKAARARVQVRPRAPTTATTHHPPNHQQTARAAKTKCMAECVACGPRQVTLEIFDMQGHVFQNDYDLDDSKCADPSCARFSTTNTPTANRGWPTAGTRWTRWRASCARRWHARAPCPPSARASEA